MGKPATDGLSQVGCAGRYSRALQRGAAARLSDVGASEATNMGLVAELPSNLARGLSGRRDSGPRMGGYSEYSQYSQYPDYPSLDQYFMLTGAQARV